MSYPGEAKARNMLTRSVSALARITPKRWFHPVTARLNLRAEPEMRMMVDRCDPTGRALDIGAWYGPWSYWLSKRVATVEAFEPNPQVASVLRAGVRANVNVHQVAASDVVGRARLSLPTLGIGSEGTASIVPEAEGAASVEVETVCIDDFAFSDVRFVKIDVEGHEAAVLRGGIETLGAQHPVVFVELEQHLSDISETITLLESMDYEGRTFMQGEWTPVSASDLVSWQRDFHQSHDRQSYMASVVHHNGYVNDVAFVHPGSTWSPWA